MRLSSSSTQRKKEFGDFQTPSSFAQEVYKTIKAIGIDADTIIEPTCGIGAFILSALSFYPDATIYGFEINPRYISSLKQQLQMIGKRDISIQQANFFELQWEEVLKNMRGELLIIGNLPWVTNSTQGGFGGANLPPKSNFLNHQGIGAITGEANFDISEWMLFESMSWFRHRRGSIAMLVKKNVARKAISYAKTHHFPLYDAAIYAFDAKKVFNACVEACLVVLRFDAKLQAHYDYRLYQSLDSKDYRIMGDRDNLKISNLSKYALHKHLLQGGDTKWRSGIKHDSASIMELTKYADGYINALNEYVELENDLVYPLMKGSDIGSNKSWHNKFILVTQKFVGMDTSYIQKQYPKIWAYLTSHADRLDSRASIIYKNSPRFSIFGVGEYAFKKYKIAICSLYKTLNFSLIEPIEGKEVQFDDTVYFLPFDCRETAERTLAYLNSKNVQEALESLIFWDEKRPIKTRILNLLNVTQNIS